MKHPADLSNCHCYCHYECREPEATLAVWILCSLPPQQQASSYLLPSFFFFVTGFIVIKFTLLKCLIQWVLVHSQDCPISTT